MGRLTNEGFRSLLQPERPRFYQPPLSRRPHLMTFNLKVCAQRTPQRSERGSTLTLLVNTGLTSTHTLIGRDCAFPMTPLHPLLAVLFSGAELSYRLQKQHN